LIRKKLPVVSGVGSVRFLGHTGAANYAIEGDPTRLRLGVNRLRGSITIDPELALQAFQAGEGVLVLEGGEEVRLTMLGHSAGGGEVFVEVRF
jgi:hypothetical protein